MPEVPEVVMMNLVPVIPEIAACARVLVQKGVKEDRILERHR